MRYPLHKLKNVNSSSSYTSSNQSLLSSLVSGAIFRSNSNSISMCSESPNYTNSTNTNFSRMKVVMPERRIVHHSESSFFPLFTPNQPSSRDYNNLVRYSINNNSVHLFSVSRQSLSGQIWSGEIFSNQQPTYKIQYEIQSLQKMPVGQVYKVVDPSGRLVASKSSLKEIAIC